MMRSDEMFYVEVSIAPLCYLSDVLDFCTLGVALERFGIAMYVMVPMNEDCIWSLLPLSERHTCAPKLLRLGYLHADGKSDWKIMVPLLHSLIYRKWGKVEM